jgi:hypothetical protein
MHFAAKFNGKVPGTVNHTVTSDSERAPTLTTTVVTDKSTTDTTTVNTLHSSSPNMPTTTTNLKEPETSNKLQWLTLETGSPLFYGLVAAGSAIILILLLCVIGVSILACRRGCKCV